MWTPTTRVQHTRVSKRYQTDSTSIHNIVIETADHADSSGMKHEVVRLEPTYIDVTDRQFSLRNIGNRMN